MSVMVGKSVIVKMFTQSDKIAAPHHKILFFYKNLVDFIVEFICSTEATLMRLMQQYKYNHMPLKETNHSASAGFSEPCNITRRLPSTRTGLHPSLYLICTFRGLMTQDKFNCGAHQFNQAASQTCSRRPLVNIILQIGLQGSAMVHRSEQPQRLECEAKKVLT